MSEEIKSTEQAKMKPSEACKLILDSMSLAGISEEAAKYEAQRFLDRYAEDDWDFEAIYAKDVGNPTLVAVVYAVDKVPPVIAAFVGRRKVTFLASPDPEQEPSGDL